jgi:hypothetical protein
MGHGDKWTLTPAFKQQLKNDGFHCIGFYEINGKFYKIRLRKQARNRQFTIYTFVSFADGGKHIRIGKVEKTRLKDRLTPNNVCKALHLQMDIAWITERMGGWKYPKNATPEMLRDFGQFAGGTPPWEREGWIKFTVGGRGLIFARVSATDDETKWALCAVERKLSELYDPPCNNDRYLCSARQRKAAWVTKHGKPIKINERGP